MTSSASTGIEVAYMKRYGSIFMLLCRSVLYKLVAVFFGTAALHTAVYFVLLGSQCNIETIYDHWGMKTVFGVGLFLTTALLVSTLTQSRSKLDYTIRRLRIGNRSLCVCQSVFNTACFLMFWAVEILVALLLCRLWVNTMEAESHQTVYLAFYRSELLHSLLPLDDVSRWVRNLVVFLCLGICSACGPVLQRRGDGHWGILSLPVLLAFVFPGKAAAVSNDVLIAFMAAVAAFTLSVNVWWEEFQNEEH